MRIHLSVVVTATSLMTLLAALPGAAGEPPSSWSPLAVVASAGVCSAPSGGLSLVPPALPLDSCNFCSGEDFCPQAWVRCSYLGTCTQGPDRCCNYACQCDSSCTTVSQPEEACALTIPFGCCPRLPLCQRSYCGGEGIRCTFNGCGPGGCCSYGCGPDATCTLPDPLPPNAC